jgi:transposase
MWTVWRRDIDGGVGQGGRVSSPRRGYPSDLTDAQWALIEGLLPEPNMDGRREKQPRREIVNAILYVVRSGCPWRYLPADLPPWQTVYWYFTRWEDAGVTEKLLATLRIKARVQDGRNPEPSAGIIDSQSVKGADTVGTDTRGYDAGKKTSDALTLSSSESKLRSGARWEGGGLVVEDALREAMVQAANQSIEEVALGGRVPVAGLAASVVVRSCAV